MDVAVSPMRKDVMETSLQKRLKAKLDETGINPHEAAKRAGLGDSFVRDILRGRSKNPTADKLEKLAKALGTTLDWFVSDKNTKNDISLNVQRIDLDGLMVKGAIQAGTWLDMSVMDDDPDDKEIIPVARDPRFPYAKQYGLRVRGDSMDLEYPDNSYVSVVDFADSGLSVRPGLIVHVERRSGHLVEATLKLIAQSENGRLVLKPRSSNPKHQPIELDGDTSTEIVLCGVVTGSYRRTAI